MILDTVPQGYFHIKSSLIDDPPKAIAIVPLVYEERVSGILELGTATPFSEAQIEFLESAGESLAVAFNSLRARKEPFKA